jgi:hypothetical protein
LVEQLIRNQQVLGSSPSAGSRIPKILTYDIIVRSVRVDDDQHSAVASCSPPWTTAAASRGSATISARSRSTAAVIGVLVSIDEHCEKIRRHDLADLPASSAVTPLSRKKKNPHWALRNWA